MISFSEVATVCVYVTSTNTSHHFVGGDNRLVKYKHTTVMIITLLGNLIWCKVCSSGSVVGHIVKLCLSLGVVIAQLIARR